MTQKLNIGFMCSGGGSNMQAIINSVKSNKLNASLCVMITNNPNAAAIERAGKEDIPSYVINGKLFDDINTEIINVFNKHQVDIIVLAGYMKQIDMKIIQQFKGRILNIHPALLPKFGGKGMYGINVHKAVLEANEKVSGVTVHKINSEYDKGVILGQLQVPVIIGDTPESLAARVLQAEHQLYSDVLIKISAGKIIL